MQYLPCANDDLEIPNVENSSQKPIKNNIEINLKMKRFFKHLGPEKPTGTSPEIIPKSTKIGLFATSCPSCCSHGLPGHSMVPKWLPKVLPRRQNGHPRCSRGAKMVPRGAPGVQKWGPEMSKRRHRAPQMASEEKTNMIC